MSLRMGETDSSPVKAWSGRQMAGKTPFLGPAIAFPQPPTIAQPSMSRATWGERRQTHLPRPTTLSTNFRDLGVRDRSPDRTVRRRDVTACHDRLFDGR
jgi:uncharacterized lipoprotein YbaY